MKVLVGLGNFGAEYNNTRHNLGFLLIDKIIARYKLLAQGKKFKSDFFTGEIDDKKILIIKPRTYMNLSGEAVFEILNFYKIPLQNLIICHDDLDLSIGKIKYKIGGGNGGHNGLKSIDNIVGKDYPRIRLGIGRPANLNYDIADFVLSKFNDEEMKIVDNLCDKIVENFPKLLAGNEQIFLNKVLAK